MFPGNKPAPATETKEKKTGKPASEKKTLDVRNTVIKFIIDQTIGAVINIPLFLATIGAAKGQSLDQILTAIQEV